MIWVNYLVITILSIWKNLQRKKKWQVFSGEEWAAGHHWADYNIKEKRPSEKQGEGNWMCPHSLRPDRLWLWQRCALSPKKEGKEPPLPDPWWNKSMVEGISSQGFGWSRNWYVPELGRTPGNTHFINMWGHRRDNTVFHTLKNLNKVSELKFKTPTNHLDGILLKDPERKPKTGAHTDSVLGGGVLQEKAHRVTPSRKANSRRDWKRTEWSITQPWRGVHDWRMPRHGWT